MQDAVVKKEVVDIQPDLNSPIEVTERTEVMIKGKKCVLMQNPETKQLCAYPILPAAGRMSQCLLSSVLYPGPLLLLHPPFSPPLPAPLFENEVLMT